MGRVVEVEEGRVSRGDVAPLPDLAASTGVEGGVDLVVVDARGVL
jgi:hypothetical protein